MKVSDIMAELAILELDNMSSGKGIGREPTLEEGEITPEDQRKIVIGMNDALSYLFTTYIIKREVKDFITIANVRKYDIVYDDLIQLLYVNLPEAYSTDYIYHNRVSRQNMFSITNKNTILFDESPTIMEGTIEYQAMHPRIPLTGSYMEHDVVLPGFLLEAFRALVASKVFSVMGTEAAQAKAVEMQNKFNSLIAVLENRGMLDVSVPINRRDFRQSGFI